MERMDLLDNGTSCEDVIDPFLQGNAIGMMSSSCANDDPAEHLTVELDAQRRAVAELKDLEEDRILPAKYSSKQNQVRPLAESTDQGIQFLLRKCLAMQSTMYHLLQAPQSQTEVIKCLLNRLSATPVDHAMTLAINQDIAVQNAIGQQMVSMLTEGDIPPSQNEPSSPSPAGTVSLVTPRPGQLLRQYVDLTVRDRISNQKKKGKKRTRLNEGTDSADEEIPEPRPRLREVEVRKGIANGG